MIHRKKKNAKGMMEGGIARNKLASHRRETTELHNQPEKPNQEN